MIGKKEIANTIKITRIKLILTIRMQLEGTRTTL